MTDDKHRELIEQLNEDGITQARNDLEEGKYGENDSSEEYRVVEAWLEQQHRQNIDTHLAMKNEPKRLVAFVALVLAFFGLLYFIFAY